MYLIDYFLLVLTKATMDTEEETYVTGDLDSGDELDAKLCGKIKMKDEQINDLNSLVDYLKKQNKDLKLQKEHLDKEVVYKNLELLSLKDDHKKLLLQTPQYNLEIESLHDHINKKQEELDEQHQFLENIIKIIRLHNNN